MENIGLNKLQFGDMYNGKKVFITGHTGFKGSWLCIWLQILGAKLKGYSLAAENPSLYNMIDKKLQLESVYADIRDSENLEKEILNFQPDFIFHLAAQPLVLESYKYPVETFSTNVLGTINLLNALRQLTKKCTIVIITTDKVYENKEENTAFKESDSLGGYDPYSASKASVEIATQSFRFSFFNPENFSQHKKSIASARAGNIIGGGDFAKHRIIPDFIRAIENNEVLKIRNPKSVRPWQYILEPLSGYLQLGKLLDEQPIRFSSAYNFGPDENDIFTVEDLMKKCISVFQKGNYIFENNNPDFHEASYLRLDISKAKSELNWKPNNNSKIAVELTMKWYKDVLIDKQDAFETCKKNISEYVNHKYKTNGDK
jgi:CDP-glucose 4,6-dehydratase